MKSDKYATSWTKATEHRTYSIDEAISRDGTVISYRQLGQGPGLIIVHGTIMRRKATCSSPRCCLMPIRFT